MSKYVSRIIIMVFAAGLLAATALFTFMPGDAAAAADIYKKCPKCQLTIPRFEGETTVEINFCVSCGTDMKAVVFTAKSEPEKIRELIRKKKHEIGDLRQLRAMEWYERAETAEDRIYRIACLINAVELDPHNEKFLNNLGSLYDERSLTDEAISCFRKAVEYAPGYAPAVNNLAKCLTDFGKFDDAYDFYQKAVRLEDKNATAHKNFADLLVKMKKIDEAIAEYRRAVMLDPDGPAGRIAAWRIDLVNRRFKNAGGGSKARDEKVVETRPQENQASSEILINNHKMIEKQ